MLFHIWIEGYQATGESAAARYLGEVEADSFEDAVRLYYLQKPSSTFDPVRLTNWGMRHFDNEADARKFCG